MKKVDASNGSYAAAAITLRNEEEYVPLGSMSAISLSLVREIILSLLWQFGNHFYRFRNEHCHISTVRYLNLRLQ